MLRPLRGPSAKPAMQTLLIKNSTVLVTMDDGRREISGGGLFVRDGWVEQVGETSLLPQTADEVIDLSGHIVLPGFVNTHHHLFQGLDRTCRCNSTMSDWLAGLYPRWLRMKPEDFQLASEIGLVELARSGCTTVADHHYIWPGGLSAEHLIETARSVGLRFHLGRGFQNIGVSSGGFAPDAFVEDDTEALEACEQAVKRFHDSAPGSMLQVFVAPSSLRSVTPRLLEGSAELARRLGVGFHMHLGETRTEIDFARGHFGKRPAEVADSLGCLGPNSWLAHGVHFDEGDQRLIAQAGCGICHCPTSNLRLGSGIAPVEQYQKAGIRLGLGVDGSASNDSSNLIAEARLAMLLARVMPGAADPLWSPRNALELATIGGASLLGRTDIGSLTQGRAADFVAIDMNRLELLGGGDDPVAAALMCAVSGVDHSWVHGRRIVVDGKVSGLDEASLSRRYQSWRLGQDGTEP